MDISICSAYCNPLTVGHVAYFNAAKEISDRLLVIVNNDLQACRKGKFMKAEFRLEIVKNLKPVDWACLALDEDESVAKTIEFLVGIWKDASFKFVNSGDRQPDNWNAREREVCNRLGVEMVFLDMPKIDSSRNYR